MPRFAVGLLLALGACADPGVAAPPFAASPDGGPASDAVVTVDAYEADAVGAEVQDGPDPCASWDAWTCDENPTCRRAGGAAATWASPATTASATTRGSATPTATSATSR